jgi:Fic family protein
MSDSRSTTPSSEDFDLLIRDENQIAQQEARNGLLQFDEVIRLIEQSAPVQRIEFTPHLIAELNRLAIQGIRRSAGEFRSVPVSISGTSHKPPHHDDVPALVKAMCLYANNHWLSSKGDLADALHISAYLMWRVNWIHPFRDGNGRTSRAVSYLALSTRLGLLLPGTPTIADQIVDFKEPYYKAIDAADSAWKAGILDVNAMERLIERLLAIQLRAAVGG